MTEPTNSSEVPAPVIEPPVPVIKAWLDTHFDDFAGAFTAPFETIEIRTTVAGQNFRAMFLGSSAQSWLDEPKLVSLVSKASSAGIKHLDRAMRGVVWNVSVAGPAVVVGTKNFSRSVENRVSGYSWSDLQNKVKSEHDLVDPAILLNINRNASTTLEQMVASDNWQHVVDVFASTPMGVPTDVRMVTPADINSVVLPFPFTQVGYSQLGYPYGTMVEDVKLMSLFGFGRNVFYVPIGPVSGDARHNLIAFSYPTFGDRVVRLVDISTLFGPARLDLSSNYAFYKVSTDLSSGNGLNNVRASNASSGASEAFGLLTDANMQSVTALNWLPLFGPPGDYEMGILSDMTRVNHESVTDGLWTHRTIDIEGDVYTAIPVDWYTTYVLENQNAKNLVALDKSKVDLEQYAGHTLCAVSLTTPYVVPSEPVTRLRVYNDYKKSKEKACKENDFMDQQFLPHVTFRAAQEKLVAASPLTEVFSYRDPSSVPLPVDLGEISFWVGFTLTWQAASLTLTTVRPDSTPGPTLTSADGETFVEAYYGGAKVVGGTITSILTAWGISPTDYVSRSAGLSSTQKAVMKSNRSAGSQLCYTAFDWRSITINGFPAINNQTPDEAIRAGLSSVVGVAPLGNRMRKMFLSYGQDALVRSALVPPAVTPVV